MVKLTDEEKAMIIIEEVCDFYKTKPDKLITSCRKRKYCMPKQLIYYYMRKNTFLSLNRMGDYFKQNHATVLHGIATISNLMTYNGYAREYDPVRMKIEKRIANAGVEWVRHMGTMITNYNQVEA